MISPDRFPKAPFLDGEFRAGAGAPRRTLIDPATGEACGELAEATVADGERAVGIALRAFEQRWKRTFPGRRADLLDTIAGRIESGAEEIAWADCWSMGKPIAAARSEARYGAAAFRYYAGALAHWGGQTLPVGRGGLDFTLRVPFGVALGIVPWNFPFPIACWKAAAALAAGNCMILKPAETTPWSALLLGAFAAEAGLPDGVLQVLPGGGATVGEALVRDKRIRKISFTGSTATGRRVLELGAAQIKRVSLELGGKSPNLIFADCDLPKAADCAPLAVFDNTGQDCCARSRILVEATVAEEFIQRFLAAMAKLKPGDPKSEETVLGPLAHRKQFEIVKAYVAAARKAGRRLLYSGGEEAGREVEQEQGEHGYFFPPVLVLDCESSDPWWREEIFGPVASLRRFATEEQATREANDSSYGLSGSLWTGNLNRALRLAREMDSGVISINSHSSVHLEAPFGGCKESGLGRELGTAALEAFTEIKNIYVGEP